MYFPPYKTILESIGLDQQDVAKAQTVTIPVELFRFLMQAALATSEFDEKQYLQANPDVRDAVDRGTLGSAREHFLGYGYFEGRPGTLPRVDESWYLQTYKDVATAVSGGKVVSATKHFEIAGAAEGRAPARGYEVIARHWKTVLGKA